MQSSYTPFLTENIYQGLRPFIPEQPGADVRSIHFLPFPEVKEEYFDEVIERKVKRMQAVIELTRNVRERHNLSLKTPLQELLVFHADPQYLEDVKELQRYVQSELNVRDIVFTSDETAAGVKYRAVADWAVLGRKLRKDLGKVKNALPSVFSDDVRKYVETGKLTVAGIELVTGDLAVQRYIELPEQQGGGPAQYATNTDNEVVVRLDITVHPELQTEYLAREFINRVQKLRKRAGLQATDDVDVYHSFEQGTGDDLRAAVEAYSETIEKTVRSVPRDVSQRGEGRKVLVEEEQEIAEVKFTLSLAWR